MITGVGAAVEGGDGAGAEGLQVTVPPPPPSFWLETCGVVDAPTPPLRGRHRVDVVVVGAGFAGLSTALALRRSEPSLRVLVLDGCAIGHGASGRNAGFAMTLFGLTVQTTVLRFGKQRAREAHAFMKRAVSNVERLVRDDGVQCDFEMSGLLTVATSKAYEKRLQSEIATARSAGIDDVEWLDAAATRARVESPAYRGARWEAHSALVNPARLAHALGRLAREAGAEIHEGVPVRAVRVSRPFTAPVLVETEEAQIEAARVVLATNAWSSLFPSLASKQFPVFTYIVVTEPLDDARLAPIRWHGREGIEDARALIHYYRLTPDNRLLMGGGDAFYYLGGGFGRDQNEAAAAALRAHVARVFPSLRGVRFTHHWGGPVSVPLDFAPAMGWLGSDRRIVYSLGCVGHGVALMTMAGNVLSDLVLERDTELTRQFFVNRFVPPTPPDPFRWVLAQGIRGAMKLADRFDDARPR